MSSSTHGYQTMSFFRKCEGQSVALWHKRIALPVTASQVFPAVPIFFKDLQICHLQDDFFSIAGVMNRWMCCHPALVVTRWWRPCSLPNLPNQMRLAEDLTKICSTAGTAVCVSSCSQSQLQSTKKQKNNTHKDNLCTQVMYSFMETWIKAIFPFF